MSDYNKTVDFATKDGLTTGDPNKAVLGAELDTEFVNIETALDTKFDSGDIATLSQAQAETSDAVLMTPLKTANWADANAGMVGDIQALTDPNADRILFWDDSAGAVARLTVGANLTITGTTIDATGSGGSGDVLSSGGLEQFAAASTTSSELITVMSDETGTGLLVFGTNPVLTTPNIGTPSAGTLTSCIGLPISTGVSGLAANVATFLGNPSSANLIAAVTNETGTGALVFAESPTLVTPTLGTPASGNLSNCTGAVAREVTKYKTADQSTTTDIQLDDDTHLIDFALDASSFYRIEGYLGFTQSSDSADWQMAFTTFAALTSSSMMAHLAAPAGGATRISFSFSDLEVKSVAAITTPLVILSSWTGFNAMLLSGYVVTNGATTLDFQWAQQASSGTTILLAGSWIRITKMN